MALVEASRFQAEEVLQRHAHLRTKQQQHLPKWRDIADLIWPAKSDGLSGVEGWKVQDESRDRTYKLYDATGPRARRLLAGNLQSAVTNPAIEWFRLRFRDEDLNADYEVAPWLTETNRMMLDAYNASNFYAESFQHYAQLGTFGTACTFIGQRQDLWYREGVFSLRFETLYPGTYCLQDGPYGRVDTVMRRLKFTPRQALMLFGKEAPERVKRLMAEPRYNARMDEWEPYLHVVLPRPVRDLSRQEQNRHMPIADLTIDETDKEIVREMGWEEFPYVTSRWERDDSSAWGVGPGEEALPDVQSLNLLVENWLQMVELTVKPPLQVLAPALVNHVRFAPLALNLFEQPNAVAPLVTQPAGALQHFLSEVTRLQKQIRDAFHVDDLLALPPIDQSGKMTATEVVQRIALMQQYLGPVFTMLLTDYLDPMADRVFGLMLRAEVLPPIPLAVLQAAAQRGGQIDVEYEGPLARSQRSHEVQAYDDMLTLGAKTMEVTQSADVWDNIAIDTGFREAVLALGLRRDVLVDPRIRDQRRQARKEEQAAMVQAQMLREDASAFRQGAAGMKDMEQAA